MTMFRKHITLIKSTSPIICSLLIVLTTMIGCGQANNESAASMRDADSSIATEEHVTSSFSNEDLATQKLQDYLDLVVLRNEHPAFEADILSQLQSLSNDETPLMQAFPGVVYENIRLKKVMDTSEDSIQRIEFYVDVISEGSIKTDSITAVITKQRIELDDEVFINSKVRFEKN